MNCGCPQLAELRKKFVNVGIGNAEIEVRDDEFAGTRFAGDSTSLRSIILKKGETEFEKMKTISCNSLSNLLMKNKFVG